MALAKLKTIEEKDSRYTITHARRSNHPQWKTGGQLKNKVALEKIKGAGRIFTPGPDGELIAAPFLQV